MKFASLVIAATSLARGVLSAPAATLDQISNIMARQGYAFSSWSEGGINYRCNNGPGGSYTVDWSGPGGFVCGKGWGRGGQR